MDAGALEFIEKNSSAAMTTLRRDGTPHTVRIGVAVVDGKIWSSSTHDRVRTKHLRRDPRSTLFVFDNTWAYLGVECRVRIIDGDDVPALSVRLFQTMQRALPNKPAEGKILWYGAEMGIGAFKQLMRDEGRIIYEFEPRRWYGLYSGAPSR